MDSERPELLMAHRSGPLPSGRFSGRNDFQQLVRDALSCAALEGWPEIILSDATFEDWPLHERAVVESLQAWSASGRRMLILATQYDEVVRKHARFVAWRKTWGHIINCRICRVAVPADFPSAMWSRTWSMQRINPLRSIGISGYERENSVSLRAMLDEKNLESAPGFPSSTLGL